MIPPAPPGLYQAVKITVYLRNKEALIVKPLFIVGLALMAAAVVAGIVMAVVFRKAGKQLDAQLEKEYGKRRT